MSQTPEQIERDESASIFTADPILGNYVSHHPSNRIRLMIIGLIIYAVPVFAMQAIFWTVENNIAAIILPILFALIGAGAFWFVAHHWNREVVLYERGLSYRQGSTTAYILYANVVKLIQNIERIRFAGLSRTVYDYKLVTDIDETLIINNVYSSPERLTRSLDAFIARDRLPIIRHKITSGEDATFNDSLHINSEGIMLDERKLAWQDYKTQRVKQGELYIQSRDDDEWAVIAVTDIDNPVLFIAVLKERGQMPAGTAQEEA